MYVCVDFFGGWVGFFNGRRVCGSTAVDTKDKNSIKMLLLVLFPIQVQNTGHIYLLLVCIVALGQKRETCFSSPHVPKNRAAPVFHFIFYFKISRQKTAPKHFRARAETFAIV